MILKNMLFAYYSLLVAGTVVVLVINNSSLVADKRGYYLTGLLVPPLVLIIGALNLTFALSFFFSVLVVVGLHHLLARRSDGRVTPHVFRVWIGIWLMEVVLPLLVDFAFRARPTLEKRSLIATALFLLAVTLVAFVLFPKSEQAKGLNNSGSTLRG